VRVREQTVSTLCSAAEKFCCFSSLLLRDKEKKLN